MTLPAAAGVLLLQQLIKPAFAIPAPAIPTTNETLIPQTDADHKLGWVWGPNQRGTFDILWSCAFTVFLCSWSLQCINIPKQDDSVGTIMWRKLWLVGLAMVGPEFVFESALGQWCSARRSVKMFQELGFHDWTMTQGFYLDMGGIMLRTVDFPDIPVDSLQVHYLLSNGYIDHKDVATFVTKRNIEQKNKVDSLVRIFTVVQTLWFFINVCARAAQKLEVTTAEITTVAFIYCSLGTTFCWYHKPADIRYPDIVTTKATMAQIVMDGGERANRVYAYTPLDFISRREWPWSVLWTHWCNMLANINVHIMDPERPIKRIQTTQFLMPTKISEAVTFFVAWSYLGLFLLGWNCSFPTNVEQQIWRILSIATLVSCLIYALPHCFGFKGYHFGDDHYLWAGRPGTVVKMPPEVRASWWRRRLWKMVRKIRNNSTLKDPMLDTPLVAIMPTYIIGPIYFTTRLYVWVEDIIGLRLLPPSAFQTVSWSVFLPHV